VGEVVTEAVKPLLASGTWQGLLMALLLVVLVALAKVYGIDVLRFFKPSGPQALDPERDPSLPDAQSNLTTDPANPGGGPAGGAG
jgi:hypothetical protein